MSISANAQRGWETGGGIGITYYFGDLNSYNDFSHPGPALTAAARYNFNERLCLKFSSSYGLIYADDKWSSNTFEQSRNLNFKSSIVDLAGQFEFNFLPYIHGSDDMNFSPYLFGGMNFFYFNPKGELNEEWHALRPLGTEGQQLGQEYYGIQPGLVYGLGLKFDINYYWSINIELSGRRLFTDYLDDVSTVYPDKSALEGLRGSLAVALSDKSIPSDEFPQIGQTGRQRGNSPVNDTYNFITVSALYFFGSLQCPDISQPRY